MGRVLIIAIDAMDRELLSRFEGDLKYLPELKRRGHSVTSASVFPPDTPTAWATIYTGLNPAQHGIVLFVDPLEKVGVMAFGDVDNAPVRGRTFWDLAGAAGKRVCILFPELGCPVWPVNGIMVGRTAQRYGKFAPIQVYPAELASRYDFAPLARPRITPQKSRIPRYLEAYRRVVQAEMELGLKLWATEKWDLFFIYSLALDWLGHYLWSYFDPEDPAYPGDSPLQGAMREFYLLYDEMVGRFMAAADGDTTIIVLSDHGQGRRPLKLVNINELLRERGWLVPRIKHQDLRDPIYIIEALKRVATRLVNKFGAGAIVLRLMYHLPRSKKLFTTPLAIDWNNTAAFVTDLSGIKAYSYGGVTIQKDKLNGVDYEQLRSSLLQELGQLRVPEDGSGLVQWACRREELYTGAYNDKYPDVVFRLRDDYGVGWAIFHSLYESCPTHNIVPGSHRMDTPVFFMRGGPAPQRREMTLMDIAPTVLQLLGVEGNGSFDGKSLLVK